MDIELVPDCARCCGLCCVAPPFDAQQGFGYDKPAHVSCVHLLGDDRCAIHDDLAARGFPGCVQFGCHGAGQRITQQFFPGRHWRDSPETARQMFDAYSRLLGMHELLAMIALALRRVTDDAVRAELDGQRRRVAAACPAIVAGSAAPAPAALREQTLTLLRACLQPPVRS